MARPGIVAALASATSVAQLRELTAALTLTLTPDQLSRLDGISLVLAPAWCESYSDEVACAVSHGVPVAGTVRAAGFLDLEGLAARPGDVRALSAAVDIALAFPGRHDQAAPRWRARQVLGQMQLENALRRESGPVLASPRASAS